MFVEKLKSLLRFGSLSTRLKDIFDLFYLKDHVNVEKLQVLLDEYICHDEQMRESKVNDIVMRLSKTFRDKIFVNSLRNSDKKWIDEEVDVILNELIDFVKKL